MYKLTRVKARKHNNKSQTRGRLCYFDYAFYRNNYNPKLRATLLEEQQADIDLGGFFDATTFPSNQQSSIRRDYGRGFILCDYFSRALMYNADYYLLQLVSKCVSILKTKRACPVFRARVGCNDCNNNCPRLFQLLSHSLRLCVG